MSSSVAESARIQPYIALHLQHFPHTPFVDGTTEVHPMWSGEGNISYLVVNTLNNQALLIDPDLEILGSYLLTIASQKIELVAVLDTHNHAEHASCAPELKKLLGVPYIMHTEAPSKSVTQRVNDGEVLTLAGLEVRFIHAPGHVPHLVAILIGKHLFTGDSLFLHSCGRADFPVSDAGEQFDSIHKLAQLPEDTLIHPGHDYNNELSVTIGEARQNNKRLQFTDKETFVDFMAEFYQDNEKPDDWEYYVQLNTR